MNTKTGNKSPIILGLPKLDYRQIILNDIRDNRPEMRDRPIEKQGIYLFNLSEYKNKQPELLDKAKAYFDVVEMITILPSNDFFVVDPRLENQYIYRIIKEWNCMRITAYRYDRIAGYASPVANLKREAKDPNANKTTSKKAKSKPHKTLFSLMTQVGFQDVTPFNELIMCLLYELIHFDVEYKSASTAPVTTEGTTTSLADRPVIERVIDLTKPRKRYVDPNNPKPQDLEMGYEFDRRGFWRTLRSGKEVWVKSCTVNEGSPRGRINHTYKINRE